MDLLGSTGHVTGDWTVASPADGTFEPVPIPLVVTAEGELVTEGEVIAEVSGAEVRSPVGGWFMEFLAVAHTEVWEGQPLARLRPINEHAPRP